jgi:NAD(P)-dependent dehydrogenase (short-subunit alcohol dehydrogenase family)
MALTKTVAREYAARGITAGLDPEAIGMTNASGRLGEPDEIGYGVLSFASDASSFCSGQTLYVHGGPGPAGI